MGDVVDRSRWPVVAVSVEEPADLDTLADELEEIVAEEQPFALSVVWPRDIDTLQRMLWAAPAATRRRLRRQRAALAVWCDAAAHVLTPVGLERLVPSSLRSAELIWGCATLAVGSPEEASDWLLARLGGRAIASERQSGTAVDRAVPAPVQAL